MERTVRSRIPATPERTAERPFAATPGLGVVVIVSVNLCELSATTDSLRKQVGAVSVNIVTRGIVGDIQNLSGAKCDACSVVSVGQTIPHRIANATLVKVSVVTTANGRLLNHDRLALGWAEREAKPHMRRPCDV